MCACVCVRAYACVCVCEYIHVHELLQYVCACVAVTNLRVHFSLILSFPITVPEPPQTSDVRVIPHYNASDEKLIGLDVNFVELVRL